MMDGAERSGADAGRSGAAPARLPTSGRPDAERPLDPERGAPGDEAATERLNFVHLLETPGGLPPSIRVEVCDAGVALEIELATRKGDKRALSRALRVFAPDLRGPLRESVQLSWKRVL